MTLTETLNFISRIPAKAALLAPLFGALCVWAAGVPVASAAEPDRLPAKEVPCAILGKYEGEIQILDPTRTHVVKARENGPVPCGAWVSVSEGWAELRHRQGHEFKLGPDTFVEVFDNVKDRHLTGNDHLVLYRGKVYATAASGDGELRLVTANSRARLRDSVALLIFSKLEQETQLTAIEKTASLENRFEPRRRVKVRPGEATALNFKALRVVPSMPAAVNVAAMKEQLSDVSLTGREFKVAVEAAYARTQRKFPTVLARPSSGGEAPKVKTDRKWNIELEDGTIGGTRLSSRAGRARDTGSDGAGAAAKKRYTYRRHPARSGANGRRPASVVGLDGTEKEVGHQKWVERLVGGAEIGEQILFPDKYYGRPQKARVTVQDDDVTQAARRAPTEEELEKRRLIEELSRIRSY